MQLIANTSCPTACWLEQLHILKSFPYYAVCVVMKAESRPLTVWRICQWAYLKVERSMRAALAGWARGKYGVSSTYWSGGRISDGISTSSLHKKATDLAPNVHDGSMQLPQLR